MSYGFTVQNATTELALILRLVGDGSYGEAIIDPTRLSTSLFTLARSCWLGRPRISPNLPFVLNSSLP
jgi:hypothetical protein